MDNSRATDPDFVNCSVAIQSPAEAGKATKRPRKHVPINFISGMKVTIELTLL